MSGAEVVLTAVMVMQQGTAVLVNGQPQSGAAPAAAVGLDPDSGGSSAEVVLTAVMVVQQGTALLVNGQPLAGSAPAAAVSAPAAAVSAPAVANQQMELYAKIEEPQREALQPKKIHKVPEAAAVLRQQKKRQPRLVPSTAAPATSVGALPAGWYSMPDPKTGNVYYYTASGKTQWEMPVAAAGREISRKHEEEKKEGFPARLAEVERQQQQPQTAAQKKGDSPQQVIDRPEAKAEVEQVSPQAERYARDLRLAEIAEEMSQARRVRNIPKIAELTAERNSLQTRYYIPRPPPAQGTIGAIGGQN